MRNVYHVNHIIHQLALHLNILRHVDIPQCADMPHSPLHTLNFELKDSDNLFVTQQKQT